MDLGDALAVLAALVDSARHPEADAALPVVRRELDAARSLNRYLAGVTCREGHHTRYADLLAQPEHPDWRCAHCVSRALDAARQADAPTTEE